MAARLSSTGISHHNLLPHILSIRLSTVNSSPHPRIVSQSLHSSSQPRCLAGDLHPCPGYVWLWQELSDPFRLPQISCFPLSLFWLRQLPQRGVWTLEDWFLHLPRAGPVLLTLLFFPLVPSSYWVLHGSEYFFRWSGTADCSQLQFCMHFCVWWCVPDVSMEREILHVHLLLFHLILLVLLYFSQCGITAYSHLDEPAGHGN